MARGDGILQVLKSIILYGRYQSCLMVALLYVYCATYFSSIIPDTFPANLIKRGVVQIVRAEHIVRPYLCVLDGCSFRDASTGQQDSSEDIRDRP